MLWFLLYETRVGRWVLARFEQWTGLAVVPSDMLAEQPSGAYVE